MKVEDCQFGKKLQKLNNKMMKVKKIEINVDNLEKHTSLTHIFYQLMENLMFSSS
ncbi:MAG: hypothetical protein FWH29_00990 [Methanobrevibacter sp.]|nr:hypothetical protein [Methanobrevibacter sp.]